MIANSTQISNRMFRSQRIIILSILAAFLLLLGITGFSGHHNQVMESMKTASNSASDKISEFYKGSNYKANENNEEDAKADADKLAQLDANKQEEAKEQKEAKQKEKLQEEQIQHEDSQVIG